jgi:hypothetical protein
MAGRHPRISGTVAVILVLAAGIAAGWLVGGSDDGSPTPAQAAEPIEFTPVADVGGGEEFTPAADIESLVTIRGEGSYGGTGSNFVCDRERLIGYLEERQERLRTWARVQAIAPTSDAVAEYIRALRPATLLEPTRVTSHKFINGRAVASQAILEQGTAVLVDDNGAVRVRCRTGSPLLDPIVAGDQTCSKCPAGYKPPANVKVSSAFYVHPDPPVIQNQKPPAQRQTKPITITVTKEMPKEPEYVVKETTPDRGTRVRTVEKVRTVFKTRTRTQTVRTPARTRTVTRTVRVTLPPRTITNFRTITVYEGAG